MATYKVLQDIEAEDKLLGPLTLRQFIYAIITVTLGFVAFRVFLVQPYLSVIFLPPMALFGVLSAPLGHDQSSEVWLLARIRFFLKPRRRIWDQSGAKELVTITAPKRLEKILTKNLSQTEVRSRLEALANTIDSRGWAIKNVNVNLYSQPAYVTVGDSDRLVGPSMLPQDVPNYEVYASDDMLDPRNNPTAQHFDQMITQYADMHKQQVRQMMQQPAAQYNPAMYAPPAQQPGAPAPDYWFMNQNAGMVPQVPAGYTTFNQAQVVTPGAQDVPTMAPRPVNPTPNDVAVLDRIHENQTIYNPMNSRIKKIMPISNEVAGRRTQIAPAVPQTPRGSNAALAQDMVYDADQQATKNDSQSVTAPSDPAILELANNDDLSVATIARQAKKRNEPKDDEVVISLR